MLLSALIAAAVLWAWIGAARGLPGLHTLLEVTIIFASAFLVLIPFVYMPTLALIRRVSAYRRRSYFLPLAGALLAPAPLLVAAWVFVDGEPLRFSWAMVGESAPWLMAYAVAGGMLGVGMRSDWRLARPGGNDLALPDNPI
ncbi:MAG: hypothetical protein ACE5HV_01995 [Acidobacteriota bacterium]